MSDALLCGLRVLGQTPGEWWLLVLAMGVAVIAARGGAR